MVLGLAVSGPSAASTEVVRIAGSDRVATAVEVSRRMFPGGATAAVVASGWSFADALAAGPLAAAWGGPVLLNPPDRLDGRVAAELDRLGVRRVFLAGGEAALSAAVQAGLAAALPGVVVTRIGGSDRYDTARRLAAAAVARWRDTGTVDAGRQVLVAVGDHPAGADRAWPDALVAGSLGAWRRAPVLLVHRDVVPDPTRRALGELGAEQATVVGGPAALPDGTVAQLGLPTDRIGGRDRFDTAARVADAAVAAGADPDRVLLATGGSFPDSLTAAPAAYAAGGVLLLVHPEDLDRSTATRDRLWQRRDRLAAVEVVGGPAAVPDATVAQIDGLLHGVAGVRLRAEPVAVLREPLGVLAPPGDPRLFIIERGVPTATATLGRIRILRGGQLVDRPFLEVATRTDGERGLLGAAFHPDFPRDPRVFVHYSHPADGDTVLAEFRVGADPDRATLSAEVLRIDQPASNHNGGTVAFGPDGMLYLFLGDGGGAGDQFGHARDPGTPLGAVLRLDVSTPGQVRPAGTARAGWHPAVWHTGLRNPFRAAFDAPTGLLYLADVGQSSWEEVDVVDATRGGVDFGWSCREGTHPFAPERCPDEVLTDPVVEYPRTGGRCAVIGGDVYRGSELGALRGHFFYGDLCSGEVWSFRVLDGQVVQHTDWTADLDLPGQVRAFGRDAAGELYVMDTSTVYRIRRR